MEPVYYGNAPDPCALCLVAGENVDLEPRKAYRILSAEPNETGFLRVVDESGEDYFYPSHSSIQAITFS